MYNIKSEILEQMRFIGNDIVNDSDFLLQEIKKSFAFINYIFHYDKSEQVKTRFYNQELENWLATQLNPRIDFNVFEIDVDEHHFALFRVLSAPKIIAGDGYTRV
jgi:hypothetical protein